MQRKQQLQQEGQPMVLNKKGQVRGKPGRPSKNRGTQQQPTQQQPNQQQQQQQQAGKRGARSQDSTAGASQLANHGSVRATDRLYASEDP